MTRATSCPRGAAGPHTEPSIGEPESDCESSGTEIYTFSLASTTPQSTIPPLAPKSQVLGESVEMKKPDIPFTGMDGTGDSSGEFPRISTGTASLTPLAPLKGTGKEKQGDIRTYSLLLRRVIKEIEARVSQVKGFELPLENGAASTQSVTVKQLDNILQELELVAQVQGESRVKDLGSVTPGYSNSRPRLDLISDKKNPGKDLLPLQVGGSLLTSTTRSIQGVSPEDKMLFLDNLQRLTASTLWAGPQGTYTSGEGGPVDDMKQVKHLGKVKTALPTYPNGDVGAGLDPGKREELTSIPVPPHLRSVGAVGTIPLPKKKATVVPPELQAPTKPTTVPTSSSKAPPADRGPAASNTGIPKPAGVTHLVAPTKAAETGFKLPENPHVGGYDQRAVLKDPTKKVDVRGLKFTAWPEAVNRGNQVTQEKRAVIIDVPPNSTLSTISLICKNTGKLESILLDLIKGKAMVTFIEAKHADQFWRRAMKPLDSITMDDEKGITSKQQVMVRMDWPVDQIPYKIQNRLWTENASRMVIFGGWEKRNLEKVVGKPGEAGAAAEILLERLAQHYIPGGAQGRVEKVTSKDKGWGFFESTILYAGTLEAMAVFDALKAEFEFKGCDIKFGVDPCEPPVTTQW